LTTKRVLVTILRWKKHYFGDEPLSRHRFWSGNFIFWRRGQFSSPIWGKKRSILTTRPVLVTVLRQETPNFWRRNAFSSPIWGGECCFLATSLFLVTVFGRETSFFGDEASSRHRFEAGNAQFLTTKRILVANLGRGMLFFGDETESRHQFEEKKANFWWRNRISSSFWGRKGPILTTKRILVANLRREMLFFDDEAESRHQFEVKNAQFWRRNAFSSPFWGKKRPILTTKRILVANLRREMLFFGDEVQSRC